MGVKKITLPNGKTFIKSSDANHTFTGAYSDAELNEFISSLDHCVDANSNDLVLNFLVNNRDAFIYYEANTKQWHCIIETKIVASSPQCKTLFPQIKNQFYHSPSSMAVFATEIYHLKDNYRSITSDIGKWQDRTAWKNMHEITQSKVNASGYANTTWLRIAASIGMFITVKNLLAAGAKSNAADDNQTTPLHIAIKKNRLEIAKLLLQHSADPNVAQKDGMTPLHYAAALGHDECIELLLKHHANPNLLAEDDIAPLHYAIGRNKIIAIDQLSEITDPNLSLPKVLPGQEWLIYRAKELGYRSNENGICFGIANMGMQAILAEETEEFNLRLHKLFKTPIKAFNFKAREEPTGELPQETYAFFDGVELYTKSYDYPDYFDKENRPFAQNTIAVAPLIISDKLEKETSLKKGKIVELSEFNFSNVYSLTELEKLLKSLAENLTTTHAPTSLILSSGVHAISIGFNPNKKQPWQLVDANSLPVKFIDDYKKMAEEIHSALTLSKDKSIPVMFSSQIYVAEKNATSISEKISAWQASTEWQKIHEITSEKILFQSPEHLMSLLMLAVRNGDTHKVTLLLEKGALPNVKNKNGETPLLTAITRGYTDIVKILIKHHADVDLASKSGLTPLYFAAQNGHTEIIRLLFDNMATSNTTGKNGDNLLHAAAKFGHIDTVKLLLQHKLDINQVNNNNETPLHIAAKYFQLDTVKYLLTTKPAMKHIESTRTMLEEKLKTNTDLAPDKIIIYKKMIQLLTLRIELEKIFPETNADFGYKFAGFFQSSKNAEAAKTIKNVLYGNADTSTLDKYQTTLHEKSFEEKIYKPCSELYREKFPEPIIKNPQAIKSSG